MKVRNAGGVDTARFAGALIQTANPDALPCSATYATINRFAGHEQSRGANCRRDRGLHRMWVIWFSETT